MSNLPKSCIPAVSGLIKAFEEHVRNQGCVIEVDIEQEFHPVVHKMLLDREISYFPQQGNITFRITVPADANMRQAMESFKYAAGHLM